MLGGERQFQNHPILNHDRDGRGELSQAKCEANASGRETGENDQCIYTCRSAESGPLQIAATSLVTWEALNDVM
jgi:hypothetical protein